MPVVLVDLLFVLGGLVLLAPAADQFVMGAARAAAWLGIPPIVIGAVIIGFGTSAPELMSSIAAAADGSLDMAVGNAVGSNLANITLVLGVAGLLHALDITPDILRREAPISLAAVCLMALLVQDGLTRMEGLVLLAAMTLATLLILKRDLIKKDTQDDDGQAEYLRQVEEFEKHGMIAEVAEFKSMTSRRLDIVRVVGGLITIVVAAQLLVSGAVDIAEELGICGGFVGLTLVALGTSLPEVVASIASARRGETDCL